MYILNLGVQIWAFSGIASDKITVLDLLLSMWEIVGFMFQKKIEPFIKNQN